MLTLCFFRPVFRSLYFSCLSLRVISSHCLPKLRISYSQTHLSKTSSTTTQIGGNELYWPTKPTKNKLTRTETRRVLYALWRTCSTRTSPYCELSASCARQYSAADRVLSRSLVEGGIADSVACSVAVIFLWPSNREIAGRLSYLKLFLKILFLVLNTSHVAFRRMMVKVCDKPSHLKLENPDT